MAQFPPAGAPRRPTVLADHLIEYVKVSVSNSETGAVDLTKQHRFIPAVVVVNVQTISAPHVNLYMDKITKTGNWASGSITIAGGTTAADLNGDTFILEDKDSIKQTFTFNNTDDVVTGGSIGLLTALDESTIITRTKTSINNVASLSITADDITVGSTTKASATDGIIFTASALDDETLTITLPTGYGADAGKAVEIVFQDTAGMSGTPTANQIFVHQGAGTAAGIINLKRAINGFSNEATIKYGSGIAGGATNGISSLEATDGTTAARLTLTADIAGGLGNSITMATTVTGATVSASLSGGAATQTLELIQDITGSAGNNAINMSSVTGGSSIAFVGGNNYGKVTFRASESFTGTVQLRAASLQNQYIM